MSSKPLEVRVPITELPTFVKKKSKQTDLNDTLELMSLPINDLSLLNQNIALVIVYHLLSGIFAKYKTQV